MRVLISAVIAASLLLTFAAVWAADQEPEMVSVEGEHIILKLRADDMKLLKDPKAWVAKLDRTYVELADLVGAVPFNGEKVTILSVEDNPGGWAVAGNPIRWWRKYIPPALDNVNKGDWLFGIMHEISHNFELEERWDWGAEFWANYKLEYVFDKTKCTIFFDGGVCDYSKPDSPKALDHGQYSEMPKEIGWEPFKQTFRWFNNLKPDQITSDPLNQCSMFIRKLEDESGKKLSDKSYDWGDWGGILTVDAKDADETARILNTKAWKADVAQRGITAAPGEKVTIHVDVLDRNPVTFKKGLGTHPYSEFVYDLGGKYKTFESYVGVAGTIPAAGRWGSVIFEVVADGKKVYKSPVLVGGGVYEHVSLPMTGVKELKLIVNDAGDPWGDGCAWVDTKVIDAGGAVTYVSDMEPTSLIEGYGGLHKDACIDDLPLTFVYNVSTQSAKIVGMVDGKKSIKLQPTRNPGVYEYTFDEGFDKGKHFVNLTINVGDKRITQHEQVIVEVK